QEEEQILQNKARPGETSRGHGHYTSVKRPERKSDADGTATLKGEEVGGGRGGTGRAACEGIYRIPKGYAE
ncbi:hypothetical protein JG688_00011872, partial [Phytophthora aleatoria]